jgi:general secretion pathway protein L
MTTIAARNWHKIKKSQGFASVAEFARWWKDELIGGLPPRWQDFLDHRPDRLLARVDADEVVLWRDHNGGEELGRFRFGDDLESSRQTILASLGQIEGERPQMVFLIESSKGLRKSMVLPAAAEENLRQVLAFEMDRHTPFKADQVYFDFHITGREAQTRKLHLDLFVVPRVLIDRIIQQTTERGLPLDGIDFESVHDQGQVHCTGINLLPPALRAPRNRRQLRWNLFLGALFIALFYIVMWQSLASREQAIDAFQLSKDASSQQARAVAKLRDELAEAREAARFLSDKKAQQPVVMNLLMEITSLLPDDAWLQRLQVNPDKVVMTGQAPDAAALIGLLQQGSKLLTAPSIKGAITPDPQSGKERFTIEAHLKTAQEEIGTTAS